MLIGSAIAACGYGLLSLLGPSAAWTMLPIFALIPFAMGLAVPARVTQDCAARRRRTISIGNRRTKPIINRMCIQLSRTLSRP